MFATIPLKYSLIANAALLGVVVLLGVGWKMHAGKLGAERDVAELHRDQALEANSTLLSSVAAAHKAARDAVAALKTEQTNAAVAIAQAKATTQAAEQRLATFQRRWSQRSASCGAALLDMERACSTEIGSY
jgi:chromosome segregation ATPase